MWSGDDLVLSMNYHWQVRIEAEVQVLELDESYLAPYTFDYTLRVEEARAFAEEVAHYRSVGGSFLL